MDASLARFFDAALAAAETSLPVPTVGTIVLSHLPPQRWCRRVNAAVVVTQTVRPVAREQEGAIKVNHARALRDHIVGME